MVKQERRRLVEPIDEHLFLAAGDLVAAGKNAALLRGQQMVAALNAMGVDVAVLGNHEFDQGSAVYDVISHSRFPWLGANVLREGQPIGPPFVTRELFDRRLKLGIFGVCTTETPQLAYPPPELVFVDPISAAREAVEALSQQGCQLIIGLTHLSIDEDVALARAVPNIDLIVGGHDHTPITRMEGRTLIHKCGVDAEFLGRLTLHFTSFPLHSGELPKPYFFDWQMLPNRAGALEPDPEVLEAVREMDRQFEAMDAEILVTLAHSGALSSVGSRVHEGTMAYVLADALRWGTDADMALVNGGFIRGNREYAAGEAFTMGMLRQELPFLKQVRLVELSGAKLRLLLEQALAQVEKGMGQYPHLSQDCQLCYDPSRLPLQRIVSLKFRGKDVVDDDLFRLATTEYLARGGDGYSVLASCSPLPTPLSSQSHRHALKDDTYIYLLVAAYLRSLPKPFTCSLQGRVIPYRQI